MKIKYIQNILNKLGEIIITHVMIFIFEKINRNIFKKRKRLEKKRSK